MITKDFNIKLDISSNSIFKTNINVVQNDKNTNIFNFTLYKSGMVIDLSSLINQSITIKLSNGKAYTGKPEIVSAVNGTMKYILQTDDISHAGEAIATVQLFEGVDNRVTTCMFTFNITSDLGVNSYVSTNDFPTLPQLINAYNNEPIRQANEAQRITNEDAREDAEILRMISEEERQNLFNAMIQNGYIRWLQPVSSFSAIATTYPTPSINDTVQVTADNKVYRWNGFAWGYILAGAVNSTINYLWIEERTILSGGTSFTLLNSVASGQKLVIKDKTYGVEWYEGASLQWTRSGQVINFNDAMPQDLTFQIINFG